MYVVSMRIKLVDWKLREYINGFSDAANVHNVSWDINKKNETSASNALFDPNTSKKLLIKFTLILLRYDKAYLLL